MTVNSGMPTFANHEFCARRPPFGQENSIRNLPVMPVVRYAQRQAPLVTPPANVRHLLQIRAQTTRMTRPEVLAATVGNDATPAGTLLSGIDLFRLTVNSSCVSLFNNDSQ